MSEMAYARGLLKWVRQSSNAFNYWLSKAGHVGCLCPLMLPLVPLMAEANVHGMLPACRAGRQGGTSSHNTSGGRRKLFWCPGGNEVSTGKAEQLQNWVSSCSQIATKTIEEGVGATKLAKEAGATWVDINVGCPIKGETSLRLQRMQWLCVSLSMKIAIGATGDGISLLGALTTNSVTPTTSSTTLNLYGCVVHKKLTTQFMDLAQIVHGLQCNYSLGLRQKGGRTLSGRHMEI
eukprot:scaffold9158_cov21-Tisochrysis_lutea.AAC.1